MAVIDVDNFAHIGGFLMGILVGMVLYPIISETKRHKMIIVESSIDPPFTQHALGVDTCPAFRRRQIIIVKAARIISMWIGSAVDSDIALGSGAPAVPTTLDHSHHILSVSIPTLPPQKKPLYVVDQLLTSEISRPPTLNALVITSHGAEAHVLLG
ncbi:hypothetical protein EIP86_010506 [Pleurotus ostreatoroseus]|nr:hypothetical protein EIP86_010506 [Pleurotus ostreatoroseus]